MTKFKAQQGALLPYYWFNGQLYNSHEDGMPMVPTFSQAMDYSMVVIDGLRVNMKTPTLFYGFRMEEHMKRMLNGWKELGCHTEYSLRKIMDGLYASIQQNLRYMKTHGGGKSLYVRPKIYSADQVIKPKAGREGSVVIECFPLGDYVSSEGLKITVSEYPRTHRYSTYSVKGGGKYVEYGSLRDSREGFDDVLQLGFGKGGRLIFSEGTTSNVFFVQNNVLYTPTSEDFILEGMTRNTVIDLAKYLKLKVREQEVPLSMIVECDEVFLTGTASFVVPVSSVGNRELGPNPVTQKLMKLFKKVREGHEPKFSHWLTAFEL